jgi:capsular polysaccharide biosynthesis protein
MLPEEMARLQQAEILDRVIDRLDLTEAYGHLGGTVSRQKARDRLATSLRVQEARDDESLPGWDLYSPLIEIGVFDINARRAADIANAIAEDYCNGRLKEMKGATRPPATAVIKKTAELSYETVRPDLILWLGVAASAGAAVAMVVARSSKVAPRFRRVVVCR